MLLAPNDLYPAEITECQGEPAVPQRPGPGQPRDPKAVATYIGDLRGAWADCHDDVAATAKRKALYEERYEDAKKAPIFRKRGALSWVPILGSKKD